MAKKRIVASTVNNGWVAPKVRKKRKPMTPEQREAAAERLAKARAAKAPAKNDSVCSYVLDKGDEHPLSAKKVKTWIKTQKSLASSYRSEVRRDVKGSNIKLADSIGYVRNMQHYLKHGDWCDDYYGEYAEKRVKWKTIHPSATTVM
jgi:hypothetical protein